MDKAWPVVVHAERIIVRFLRNLQFIDRCCRVVLRQLDEAVLVEVREPQASVPQMVLMKVLGAVAGNLLAKSNQVGRDSSCQYMQSGFRCLLNWRIFLKSITLFPLLLKVITPFL